MSSKRLVTDEESGHGSERGGRSNSGMLRCLIPTNTGLLAAVLVVLLIALGFGIATFVRAGHHDSSSAAATTGGVPPAGCEAWYVPPVDRPKNPAPGYLPFNMGTCTSNTTQCAANIPKDLTLQLGSCCQTSLGLVVIAQYWGPGLCSGLATFGSPSTSPTTLICSCTYKQQMRRSGIGLQTHGLWRDYCDGTFPAGATLYPNTASRALITAELVQMLADEPELEHAMRVYWSNYIPNVTINGDPYSTNSLVDLWLHEYNAHGVIENLLWPGSGCYPSNTAPDRITRARDFFRLALRSRQYFDFYEVMKANGIVPSNTPYDATTFLAAVDSITGLATQVNCARLAANNGTLGVLIELRTFVQVLNGVNYAFTPKLNAPHKCTGATQILYPPVDFITNTNSILASSSDGSASLADTTMLSEQIASLLVDQ